MKRVVDYELALLRQRWRSLLLIAIVVVILTILLSLIPCLSPVQSAFGYPEGQNRASVLLSYQQEIANLENAIASGQGDPAAAQESLRLLRFFVSTSTTEYDYLPYALLLCPREGAETIAYGVSLLEGASFISVGLALLLAYSLFAFPYEAGHLRPMVEAGSKRNDVFLGKTLVGLVPLFAFDLLVSVIALCLIGPNLDTKVLLAYGESYISVPVWNICLARTLGFILASAFYFSVSSLIGLWAKKGYLAAAIPAILLAVLWLASNASIPSWGNYGQLSGVSRWLLLCLPFSDIVIAPAFGLLPDILVLFASYFVLDALLLFALKRRFERMGL
jgi:hypothetical protein